MDYYLNLIVLLTNLSIIKSRDILTSSRQGSEYRIPNNVADNVNQQNDTWMNSRRKDNLLPEVPEALPNDPFRVFLPVRKRPLPADVEIPAEFDARKYWPYCPTIRETAFQGKCSSCWAIATTDVMSDRICIHSRGLEIVRLSAGNLLTCCGECGRGCKGGYPGAAWRYWITTGIVTGGFHKSDYGCQEYQIGPCTSTDQLRRTCIPEGSTPPCRRRCDGVDSGIFYHDDLHFGDSVYRIPNDVQQIQLEILLNGPVQTTIRIYEDLLTYRNGIYQHSEGTAKEFHAVKILGWGQENGVPYWLCANMWGTHWGEQGFFRILRGSNHAGIENNVMAGIPKLPKSLQKVRFS